MESVRRPDSIILPFRPSRLIREGAVRLHAAYAANSGKVAASKQVILTTCSFAVDQGERAPRGGRHPRPYEHYGAAILHDARGRTD